MKKIGRYEIVEELGRGAMGVVYKASDPTIGRMVAIKVLLVDDKPEEGGPTARDTFLREARAAGRLSHPGIVTIHDALEDAATNSSYIVMEYIPGKTLEKILVSTPRIGTEKALDIIRQVAEALDYAHRNQIIHRDLKPANIILTEDGRAKITDFGIAKIAAQGAMRTVAIMGTPSYMSPEQVAGGEIDARADIFSMGILLYLMLVGEKPFAGDTAAVMFKIVYEDPVLPSKLNPQLTTSDDYVVLRCLAKDRAKRYSSAREFLEDLEDIRQGRPPRSQTRVPPSEFQAAERTVAALHPLISQPASSSATAAPQPAPMAKPAAETRATPVPGSPPTALPVTPVEAAGPAADKKRSPSTVVGAFVAGIAIAVVAGSIWILQRTESPRQPQPATATGSSAIPSATPSAPGQDITSDNSASAPSGRLASPANRATASTTSAGEAPAFAQPETASTSSMSAMPAKEPIAGRLVTLYCTHELEEATLLLSSGNQIFFQGRLIGTKKRGFIGLGGKGFSGTFSAYVTIPADSQELTVRVYSADGSVNVLGKIPAQPPSADATTLRVTPRKEQLTVEWSKALATGK